MAGGICLEDIELWRNDEVYLDALGAQRIPDPTTAGDFCRRFDQTDVEILMNTINDVRVKVWQQQPESFLEEAIVEGDGTMAETTGQCKQGMDINHKGQWGYHPLLISLANTKTKAANAIILQYTSTFWVFGLSPWILRERPRAADLWLLGFALTGIAIIFLGNAATDLAGLMNALGAGLFFGLLTLMIRRLRDTHSTALTVMNNLGSALLILPIVVLSGDLGITGRSAWLLLIMGVVQIGIPYCLFAQGLAAR